VFSPINGHDALGFPAQVAGIVIEVTGFVN
jgi:hypothetical protein